MFSAIRPTLADTTWELPIAVDVTTGNVHDVNKATPLLRQARYTDSRLFKPDYVICDKGYSSKKLRNAIRRQYFATPIIDPNPAHKTAYAETEKTPEWKMLYGRRTAIERLNGRLKAHRRLDSVRTRGIKKVPTTRDDGCGGLSGADFGHGLSSVGEESGLIAYWS